ncbi:MAG: hypothetical protein IKC85_07260, partial [Bacteroidaceae bacterium]|nr:hypothetical protein [Bacteroidaceae bacterium]
IVGVSLQGGSLSKASAKVELFFEPTNFFRTFFEKNCFFYLPNLFQRYHIRHFCAKRQAYALDTQLKVKIGLNLRNYPLCGVVFFTISALRKFGHINSDNLQENIFRILNNF